MNMKSVSENVFVTGGAGFIGAVFVRQLSLMENIGRIFVLDKLTYAADLNQISDLISSEKVTFLHGDTQDSLNFQKELMFCNYLVHFAAESHVDRSITDGLPFVDSNIRGTYALLNAAKINQDMRILVVSTDEVYGSITLGEAIESSPLNPSSAYSASKASADLIALSSFKTFNQRVLISRCCNNFGITQHSEKLIPTILNSALNGHSIPIYGDGQNVREWIHVSDHSQALIRILFSGNPGEIYNVGTNERYSNLEVAQMIVEHLGIDQELISFVGDRMGHDFRYALDSSKIRKEMNWHPKIDFRSGLFELIDNHVDSRKN